MNKRVFLLLLLALLIVFVTDIAHGSVQIPVTEVARMLAGAIPAKASWATILFEFRLPKAITAIAVGAGLAVSGLQMQTLFRNSLAGPDVLGISSGAGLGVALLVLANHSVGGLLADSQALSSAWAVIAAAILGAALVMSGILLVAVRLHNGVALLIVGLMFASTTGALIGVLQYFSRAEELQSYLVWTFGSLGSVTNEKLPVFIPVVLAGIFISLLNHKTLNALLLGENYAASMGVNIRRIRLLLIASTSMLAGTITAFCGPIGFVGIAVPHLVRMLFSTSNHRVLLPGVCIFGAVFMLFCDILCQFPGSAQVLPINIVTSLFGAPVVIWIVVGKKKL